MSYYDVLGLNQRASAEEIKRAYREKALLYHPDRNPGSEAHAEQQFRHVTEAYEVLRSTSRRVAYDLARSTAGTTSTSYDPNQPPNWRPGTDDFDEFFRRWFRQQGFGPHGQEEMRRAQKAADHRARAAAWEAEKAEARLNKERDERLRQRAMNARAARQAAALRQFWQTHHGLTWQDAVFASFFIGTGLGFAHLLWPSRPSTPEAPDRTTEVAA